MRKNSIQKILITTNRLITILSLSLGFFVVPTRAIAQCKPFSNTTAGLGFTQELIATIPGVTYTTGYGFDSHGNVYTVDYSTGNLYKVDLSTTVPAPGGVGTIHPVTNLGQLTYRTGPRTGQKITGGFNFTQYPDGTVYFNSNIGVVQVDLETASVTSDPLPGGAWGIVVDPQLNSHGHHNIITAGGQVIDPVDHRSLGNCGIFGDGIAIDATGNFLFAAGGLKVYKRVLPNPVSDVPVFQLVGNYGGSPDGMAFGVVGTDQVVVSNDGGAGTVTMWKFPNNDFTQTPTATVIASSPVSGEYGDQANVGPDGYFYITYWFKTRFPDCSTTNNTSVVRFGPAGRFLPPTHSDNISLTPATDTKTVGSSEVLTATLVTTDLSTNQTTPVANTSVTFTVSGGPDVGQTFTGTTDANGNVLFTLVNNNGAGDDVVHAQFVDGNGNTQTSNNAVITFVKPTCTAPAFASCPGNQTANTSANSCDNTVTYSSLESVTGSPAPTVTYEFTGATTGSGSGDGSGSLFNKGTTTVTLTATNSCGSATCTFTVIVTDNQPPIITTNGDISVNNDPNVCGAAVTVSASATDNCSVGIPTGVRSDGLALDAVYPVGITTITWNVTDANDNAALPVTQTVTVKDIQKPTVVTKNITVQLEGTGHASIADNAVDNGSSDNCTAPANLQFSTDIKSFSCANVGQPVTVTLTVTDANGNSDSKTAQVTVQDNLKPVAKCQNIQVYLTPAGTVTITPQQVDNGSTDACGVSLSLDKTSFNTTNVGANTVTLTATDPSGNYSTCQATVTVLRRPTVLTYTGDGSEQYSDQQVLTAVLKDQLTNTVLQGKSINFTIGTQSASNVTDVTGTATANLILTQDPAPTYTVNSNFAGDAVFLASSDSDPFDILQEDARAYYSGALFASTSGATTSTANVTLSATVKDISAVPGDPYYDVLKGDIRNATVTFVNRDDGTILASNVPVGLVSLSDLTVGTATKTVTLNIGTADAKQFTIGIIVNNYYTRNSSTEDAIVTVSKPLDNFVTGGGYIVLTSASAGQKAGTPGTNNNFGFNVKYNKSNTNLQGNINTIVQRLESDHILHVYQIKGNSMTSLAVNSNNTAAKTAIFNGKASIQDITNPVAPISVDGNATLQVAMTDRGDPGNTDDIGITVWNKSGGLWFSSNWNGTTTINQTLAGGNLKVNGASYNVITSTTAIPTSTQDAATPKLQTNELQLTVFPNPTAQTFNIVIESFNVNEKIRLRVLDVLGRVIETRDGLHSGQIIKLGGNLIPGTYIIEAVQARQSKSIKVVKIPN